MHGAEQPWGPQVIFGLDAALVSTLFLIVDSAVIMSERLNRAVVALIGADVIILAGVLNSIAFSTVYVYRRFL